jgi:hypothetical protein
MKKVMLLLAAAALSFTVACNNATEEENMDHAGHDHAAQEGHDMGAANDSLVLGYPDGARVFFPNLTDGQEIKLPFQLQMGVEVMEVEPAGALNYGKGHHHLIIDGQAMDKGTSVPFDATNIHFGKGQTEYTLDSLAAGVHTLTLQFANGAHLSYGEGLSTTIKVVVK